MAVKIQIRNGLASEWAAANPILAVGELAIESDTKKFKIGNGLTAWTSLAYATQGEIGPPGPVGPGLEFHWSGTQLGIRMEGESTYQYVNLVGPKGDPGDDGRGISSVTRTSGTGAAGTTDTYTITFTDDSTTNFNVYNGSDGEGAGYMLESVYDPNTVNGNAFDMDNMAESSTKKILTSDERIKLGTIAEGAEVNVPIVNNLTTETTGSTLDATQGKALNDLVSNKLTKFVGMTAGTSTVLTATITDATLADYTNIQVRLHADLGASATLNLNGLGAKPIYTSGNVAVGTGALTGSMLNLMYNSTLERWYLLDILSVSDGKTHLYKLGDECTALTGGWSQTYKDTSNNGTITEDASYVTIFRDVSTAWGGLQYGTANAIDLTNISTLYIDWSASHGGDSAAGAAKFTVNPTKQTSTETAAAQLNIGVDFTRKTDALDVSALTGTHYIGVVAINDSNFSRTKTVIAYNIWGE